MNDNDNNFIFKLDFTNLPSLIGRSNEQQILDDCYFRMLKKGAKGEIILVHGESGVGKSSLIQHLERKVLKSKKIDGGYFVSGKYEQLQNATRPYGAIVDAITELCNQVSDNAETLRQVQNEMFDALGKETSVLTNLIPSLIELLKPSQDDDDPQDENGNIENIQTTVPDLQQQQQKGQETSFQLTPNSTKLRKRLVREYSASSMSSHHSNTNTVSASKSSTPTTNGFSFRIFVHLFRTFLRTFCKPTRPLILFLDDLQWSDDSSQKLIQMVTADPTLQNLLVVGAYRDNDDAIYEFDSKSCKFHITDLVVGPLSQESIGEIVASVTRVSQDETKCRALSEVVLYKTGGNVFFAIRYLEALYRQNLLYYDIQCARWDWNVDKIKVNTSVSDNIVDLLIGKLHSLSEEQQSILMFAACIGYTFDTDILKSILESENVIEIVNNDTIDEARFADLLVELSIEGLLEPFNERKYQFTHDRVQQSAYALLPQEENGKGRKEADRILICVGEHILEHCKQPNGERAVLFRAVDLLSEQSIYTIDTPKKLELVDLNIQAAKEAIPQMAFLSAAHYVKQAIDLMDESTMWQDNYDIALELFTMHAKMQHACGNPEKCMKIIEIILENAKTLEDQLPAFYQKVVLFGEQADITNAISLLRMIFKKLGVSLPVKGNKLNVVIELIKTKNALKGRSAKDLVELPTMTNPTKILTVQFLLRFALNAYELEELDNTFIAALRTVRMTVKHGVCPDSVFGLMAYGMVLGALGDTNGAYEYGRLGCELLKRPGMEASYVSGVHNGSVFLDHLKKHPVHSTLSKLLEAHRIGMEQGDVEYSVICLVSHALASVAIGMRLDNLNAQLRSYCDLLHEFKQESRLLALLPYYQFALNLAGKSAEPLKLVGEAIDETTYSKINGGNSLVARQLYFCNLMLHYLFESYDLADQNRKILATYDLHDTHFIHYSIATYCGLICFGIARQCQKKNQQWKKKKYERLAQPYVKRITKYTNDGSVNGPPMLKLLQAEALSLKRGITSNKVREAYDVAIQFARRSGFRLFTGIALERAGDYFYSIAGNNSRGIKEEYIMGAYMEFEDICAFGKTKLLKEKYPWLNHYVIDSEAFSSDRIYHSSRAVSKKMRGTVLTSLKDNDMNHKRGVSGRCLQGSLSKDFIPEKVLSINN